eukprot:m.24931 g.24931  ORF g.24931 m.24931 type:complete len:550 (-) comp8660_c1_seq1:126-1775(-)
MDEQLLAQALQEELALTKRTSALAEHCTRLAPFQLECDSGSLSNGSQSPSVCYRCSCGEPARLYRMFWCLHCISLRCARCVSQEIDIYFSADCSDQLPATKADSEKHRDHVLDCPMCQTVLGTYPLEDVEGLFELRCSVCCWASSSIGLVGPIDELQPKALQLYDESEAATTMQELIALYNHAAQIEAEIATEQRAYEANKSFRHGRSKVGRRPKGPSREALKAAILERGSQRFNCRKREWVDIPAAPTVSPLKQAEGIEQPPAADEYTTSDISTVSTLEQRYRQLHIQPHFASKLIPSPHPLLAKRAKRCRVCQHNVLRPNIEASSAKFKLNHFACHHVPVVTISKLPHLSHDQQVIHISLSNPTESDLEIAMLPSLPEGVEVKRKRQIVLTSEIEVSVGSTGETSTTKRSSAAVSSEVKAPTPKTLLTVERDQDALYPQPFRANCELKLPTEPIVVAGHDNLDELAQTERGADQVSANSFLLRRANNTVWLELPFASAAVPGTDRLATLILKYKYKQVHSSAVSGDAKGPQVHDVFAAVRLNFGPDV